MPYLKSKKRRKELDVIVELMAYYVVSADGDLNYILYAYAKRYVDKTYNTLKNFIGEVTESANEIRRRFLVSREKQAIMDNGDVE